jgi:hypothetical protein
MNMALAFAIHLPVVRSITTANAARLPFNANHAVIDQFLSTAAEA